IEAAPNPYASLFQKVLLPTKASPLAALIGAILFYLAALPPCRGYASSRAKFLGDRDDRSKVANGSDVNLFFEPLNCRELGLGGFLKVSHLVTPPLNRFHRSQIISRKSLMVSAIANTTKHKTSRPHRSSVTPLAAKDICSGTRCASSHSVPSHNKYPTPATRAKRAAAVII